MNGNTKQSGLLLHYPARVYKPECLDPNYLPMGLQNFDSKVLAGETSSLVTSKSFKTDDSREFICGYGAAFINICLTFPINKVIFRQMVYGMRTNSALLQLRKEGLYHLYRGLLPPLMSKTLSGKNRCY